MAAEMPGRGRDTAADSPAFSYGRGWTTETAAAVLVIGAVAFLALMRRGFRGVTVTAN